LAASADSSTSDFSTTDTQAAVAVPEPAAAPNSLTDLIMQAQSADPAVAAAARQALQGCVQAQPDNPLAHLGWGIVLALGGDFEQACSAFEQAVALDAKFASGWSNLGNIHKLQGRLKEAQTAYQKAIALMPDLADAHYNLALVLDAQGEAQAAEESLRRALMFRPAYAEAHNNLGHLRLKGGRVEQAVSHFRQALVFQPLLRQARDNLIMALYRLGRDAEALSEVERLLLQYPDDPHVLRVQAAGLAQAGQMERAAAINQKLLETEPDAADLQFNLAEIMLTEQDYAGALAGYRKLLEQGKVRPDAALGAMANVMYTQGNFSEARALYQQALGLAPKATQWVLGLSRVLIDAGETRLGLETLRRALQLSPEAVEVHSLLIHGMRLEPATTGAQRAAELAKWCQQHAPKNQAVPPQPRVLKAADSLRMAFLTGDLEQGPEGSTLQVLLQHLPKQRYDVFVYHAAKVGTAARTLQQHVAHWRPVAGLGHADLAEQIRQDGIDLVFDLIGHGPGSRLTALLEWPSAMQVSWLGDFAPSQVGACHTHLSEAVLEAGVDAQDPPDAAQGADAPQAEQDKVALLQAPFYWQAPDAAPDVVASAAIAGATDATTAPFTYGVLSHLAQINADTLDAWAALLQQAPQTRLILLLDMAADDAATRERVLRLLRLREVEAERVEIQSRIPAPQHWAAIRQLDVVLDTFPKPLGWAALDCLWMGVPVLTLAGREPWQRVTASVLAQAGLHDWVTTSSADYVQRAVAAASERPALAALRSQLRDRLRAATMMQAEAFAQSFVQAVQTLWPQEDAAVTPAGGEAPVKK
jgi:predicted O-linked N-acetylglucosamine transferase (SPINDLY family)